MPAAHSMGTGDQYRRRAQECCEEAERTADPEKRLSLLEMAQRWTHLAEAVETIEASRARARKQE
jgi:hypothetical protein